ncbi:MAG: Lrp/AsnC family transcriptional regulator [Rhodocyclaceae bacterium]|nr:Lrp/AsnC family transcriptional regulator [Rhodocyclaceae bacterium]
MPSWGKFSVSNAILWQENAIKCQIVTPGKLKISLDRLDLRMLAVLQQEGRISNADLAERIALSPSPCLRRMRSLEDRGLIAGFAALVDRRRLGLDIEALVEVSLDKRGGNMPADRLASAVAAWPEVLECLALTGDRDYLLRVVVPDLDHFSRFVLDKLLKIEGVADVKSSFVLQAVKRTVALPLDQVDLGLA